MEIARGNVELFGIVSRETEKAILFSDGTNEAWIPKSQIRELVSELGGFTIIVPEWIAIRDGFV
jgi:hypothetical protein